MYLRGNYKKLICYGNGKLVLDGYIDVYMACDVVSRKSTSCYVFTFTVRVVSW